MLKEIQVNKTKLMVYAMDENYHTIAEYPCSTDFYPGHNEYGQPYSNPDDGVYTEGIYAEANGHENDEPHCTWYGWGYIQIDSRGRALHGGGSILGEFYNEPFQKLTPTNGCIRMHNADVYHLALMFLEAENHGCRPVITVVS